MPSLSSRPQRSAPLSDAVVLGPCFVCPLMAARDLQPQTTQPRRGATLTYLSQRKAQTAQVWKAAKCPAGPSEAYRAVRALPVPLCTQHTSLFSIELMRAGY